MTSDGAAPPEVAEYPAVLRLPVQWGDQDAYRHVNNVVYFRWFESARIVYLEKIGLKEMYHAQGIGPILAAIACNYRRQLNYPDTVPAEEGASIGAAPIGEADEPAPAAGPPAPSGQQ